MKKLLVVVDYQTDFVTGALKNPAAAALEEAIADKHGAPSRRGRRGDLHAGHAPRKLS